MNENYDNNNIQQSSRFIKAFYLYGAIKQVIFLIFGLLAYIKHRNENDKCFILSLTSLSISICSFLSLLEILDKYLLIEGYNNIRRLRSCCRKFLNLTIYTTNFLLLVYLPSPLSEDIECNGYDTFKELLLAYIIIEVIIPFLFVIFVIFVVKCGMRICCPNYLIGVANTIPIRLGASDKELGSLPTYKFINNSLVNLNGISASQISDEDAVCGICMENYDNQKFIVILTCNHHYHQDCSNEWLKINKSCPFCRRQVQFDLIEV